MTTTKPPTRPRRHDLTKIKACQPTTPDLSELEFAYRRALQLLTRIHLHADIHHIDGMIDLQLTGSVRNFLVSEPEMERDSGNLLVSPLDCDRIV